VPTVVVDGERGPAWLSRHPRSRHRWRGPMEGPPFTAFLRRLAEARGLHGWLLLPMRDDAVEAVARDRAALEAVYRLVTPPWSQLRDVHEKRRLSALADAAGVPCPQAWYPRGDADLAAIQITLPAIVKPTASIRMQHVLGRKALPAHDHESLLAQYRLAVERLGVDELMVQELIPGDGSTQFSVAGFYMDGRPVAAMTARRTRQFPYDFGLSSSFVESMEVPGLIELASRLLERTGISGMLEVEFKRDPRDGRFKLLDVNVRPWGWHSLCQACGLDFVAMQYRWALGDTIEPSLPRYGPKWIRVLTDVPAGVQEMRAGRLSPRAYLRSLRGPLVFSTFDVRDPLAGLGELASAANRLLPWWSERRSRGSRTLVSFRHEAQ
ncbi:MAG TPA: hypothetical protein VE219_01350, partial [Candidatus Sulfotelmatobacter sp.]|nr:hypothetical protein [Candidatus Sulfotelmatobacter sp.]